MNNTSYWVRRMVVLVVLEAAALVGTSVLGLEPDLALLASAIAAAYVVFWLFSDALVLGDDVDWRTQAVAPTFLPGRDQKLSAYARLIEDHQTAARPSDALVVRLRALTDERLERSPGADLPDRLRDALSRPANDGHRLSLATLSDLIDDIEGLT